MQARRVAAPGPGRRLVTAVFGLATLLAAGQAVLAARPDAPVYATNEAAGTLSVIDPATLAVIRTIPLGKRPRGLQPGPDGRYLYVALSGSPAAGPGVDESTLPPPDRAADGIGVVDLVQHKVTRTLRGLTDPEQLAISPDGRRLYVASEDSGQLAAFDVASGRILWRLAVGGQPEGVGTSPDGRRVCATSEANGSVALIDPVRARIVHTVKVGRRPRNCRFSSDGRTVYVPAELGGTLSVVDVAQGRVERTIDLPGEGVRPMGIVLAPDGATAYVSTGRGGSVLAVDLTSGRVRGSAKVGTRPWGLALSADGRTLYSADGPSNTVSVVDTRSMRTTATVKVGARPWGVITGRPD